MLRRKSYDKLMEWKNRNRKKALCIIGARQIGKTTVIREFGKRNYKEFVEVNFMTDEGATDIFSGALDADTITRNLSAFRKRVLKPGKTLVLLDEIQECPNARTAIKFLVEDGRFDYIESGSMLGVRYKEVKSYPVGFEEIYHMYPMDFEEFLWANGMPESTVSYLKKCFDEKTPVPLVIHNTISKLFYNYIVVGGMPEVVQAYVETHDIGNVILMQENILELYKNDIAQYAQGNEKEKIQDIFDLIPSQLNDKNRRFYLTSIDKNARLNRYDNSFRWLDDAGVALPCYNVTAPQAPLMLNKKHSLFKLYQNDTGLLCAACMDNVQFDLLQGRLDVNMGSILENVIAQSLKSAGFKIYYFDSTKHGEVDFVIQNGRNIDLIEVKSGKDYRRHRALDNVISVDEWKFGHAYVLCPGNIEQDGDITYLPWYMVMFLAPERIPVGTIYEVDLSPLKEFERRTNQCLKPE